MCDKLVAGFQVTVTPHQLGGKLTGEAESAIAITYRVFVNQENSALPNLALTLTLNLTLTITLT